MLYGCIITVLRPYKVVDNSNKITMDILKERESGCSGLLFCKATQDQFSVHDDINTALEIDKQ